MDNEAVLSSKGMYTSFLCKGINVRFMTPAILERYTDILEWDKGYIVVMAKYGDKEVEDYIDLIPILKNLFIDPDEFLDGIERVRISYD